MSELVAREIEDILGVRMWLIRLRYLLSAFVSLPRHPDGTHYWPTGG